MQSILITGGNRGIGFELTKQYLRGGGVHIFATCRNLAGAAGLKELARERGGSITVLQMDITDEASIKGAAAAIAVEADALDLLVNNAGISPRGEHPSRHLGQLSASGVAEVITCNAVAPLIVTQAFRHLLRKSARARVVMISSGQGSLSRARGDNYGYRMSKAAMNMAARVLSLDEAMGDVITIAVNPGWVRTDMGGPTAPLSPAQSAAGLIKLMDRLTGADSGKLFQWDGRELDW